MLVADFFEPVVLLRDGQRSVRGTEQRLQAQGKRPLHLDLIDGHDWRAQLASAVARARECQSPGVLLMREDSTADEAFWRRQDHLVEHLESADWELVYLGHRNDRRAEAPAQACQMVRCDMPPDGVSALALRSSVLTELASRMPEGGASGALAPEDWLAIASWLADDVVRPQCSWAVWPPLVR